MDYHQPDGFVLHQTFCKRINLREIKIVFHLINKRFILVSSFVCIWTNICTNKCTHREAISLYKWLLFSSVWRTVNDDNDLDRIINDLRTRKGIERIKWKEEKSFSFSLMYENIIRNRDFIQSGKEINVEIFICIWTRPIGSTLELRKKLLIRQ